MPETPPKKKSTRRGFAGMTPERRREIAAKGGRSIPPEKRGFSKDPEKARAAGRIGGLRVPPEKRGFSMNPELARKAGQISGRTPRKPRPKPQPPKDDMIT